MLFARAHQSQALSPKQCTRWLKTLISRHWSCTGKYSKISRHHSLFKCQRICRSCSRTWTNSDPMSWKVERWQLEPSRGWPFWSFQSRPAVASSSLFKQFQVSHERLGVLMNGRHVLLLFRQHLLWISFNLWRTIMIHVCAHVQLFHLHLDSISCWDFGLILEKTSENSIFVWFRRDLSPFVSNVLLLWWILWFAESINHSIFSFMLVHILSHALSRILSNVLPSHFPFSAPIYPCACTPRDYWCTFFSECLHTREVVLDKLIIDVTGWMRAITHFEQIMCGINVDMSITVCECVPTSWILLLFEHSDITAANALYWHADRTVVLITHDIILCMQQHLYYNITSRFACCDITVVYVQLQ